MVTSRFRGGKRAGSVRWPTRFMLGRQQAAGLSASGVACRAPRGPFRCARSVRGARARGSGRKRCREPVGHATRHTRSAPHGSHEPARVCLAPYAPGSRPRRASKPRARPHASHARHRIGPRGARHASPKALRPAACCRPCMKRALALALALPARLPRRNTKRPRIRARCRACVPCVSALQITAPTETSPQVYAALEGRESGHGPGVRGRSLRAYGPHGSRASRRERSGTADGAHDLLRPGSSGSTAARERS